MHGVVLDILLSGRPDGTCDKLTRRAKFRFPIGQITFRNHAILSPEEGALAIVTERWDGMRWTRRHRARNRIAGRDKLRERSSGRADERCRSVRQNRVDLTPQWLASSLRRAKARPGRTSRFPRGDGGEKSPILRGEREISRQAIAQGMSDVLRCPVCSCAAFLHNFAHETAGAARIRHSLLPHSSRDNETQTSGASRREKADVYLVFENESHLPQ